MEVSHEIVVKMFTGLKAFLGMKAFTSTGMTSQCWLLVAYATPCHEDFCIGLIGCPKTWPFAVSRADDPKEQGRTMTQLWKSHSVIFTILSGHADQPLTGVIPGDGVIWGQCGDWLPQHAFWKVMKKSETRTVGLESFS